MSSNRPASNSHAVTFRFQLPRDVRPHVAVGVWPSAPRGVTVTVDEAGAVLVTSHDRHQTYAVRQVQKVAAEFLRSIPGHLLPLTAVPGTLSTPMHAARGQSGARYSIALGARVSITRILIEEEPVLLGPPTLPPALKLVSVR